MNHFFIMMGPDSLKFVNNKWQWDNTHRVDPWVWGGGGSCCGGSRLHYRGAEVLRWSCGTRTLRPGTA